MATTYCKSLILLLAAGIMPGGMGAKTFAEPGVGQKPSSVKQQLVGIIRQHHASDENNVQSQIMSAIETHNSQTHAAARERLRFLSTRRDDLLNKRERLLAERRDFDVDYKNLKINIHEYRREVARINGEIYYLDMDILDVESNMKVLESSIEGKKETAAGKNLL